MDFQVDMIRQAKERIGAYIVETPLIRAHNLDSFLGCHVYLKPECMQVTGAFKIRGAMNSMLALSGDELRCGVVTASSGNHGRAMAYAAKILGTKAVVVMPNTAPQAKVEAIRQLGAEVVLCETSERFKIAAELSEQKHMMLVPPFDDINVMAGQGTVGLEIMEQCAGLTHILVPLSGGGLLSGVSAAVKAVSPGTKVYGAEPAELPRYTESLKAGKPATVPQKKTIADALVSQTPGKLCFPVIQQNADGILDVNDEYILKGQKLLLMEGKLLAEPSSCIGIGAVLEGLISFAHDDNVCFIITGGKVGFEQIERLKDVKF